MNVSDGIKRLMILVAAIIGSFLSYKFHQDPLGNVHLFSSVEACGSFVSLGAFCTIVIWLPIKYVLRGFTPKTEQ